MAAPLQETLDLPEPRFTGALTVEEAILARRSEREFGTGPLSLAEAGQLLWAAQGITAAGAWKLRAAPSAGALYPLEVSLVAGDVSGLSPGVYRYLPVDHRLRHDLQGDLRSELATAAAGQDWVAQAACALVIAAIYRRTARKYGRRSGRYVHVEVGHAGQNVYLQARALGLGTTIVGAFDDDRVRSLLALAPDEEPVAILPVGRLP